MNLMAGLAHCRLAAAAEQCGASWLMAFSLEETRVMVTCNPDVAKEILNSSGLHLVNSLSLSEIVYKIIAYKALWEISPVVQFVNFIANQVLFEAIEGAMFIHIIDFRIGIGDQWASFMQENCFVRQT
uniref:Uncharacterized protein n=1 Tax=Nelumbo nucifera TaxID=4432 RepID=A0A822YIC1_NELNU|nr:TPA_asm: hypothetical protein HUJ06_011128 [Nelumbo nucifera]